METKIKVLTAKEKQKRIKFLQNEKNELKHLSEENRNSFKEWLNEKFKKAKFDSNWVEIRDNQNEYTYMIEDGYLRMKKKYHHQYGGGFFGMHPMDMMRMMMEEKMEKQFEQQDETIYEGNHKPPKSIDKDLFPLLKEDLINKGEISTTIKKYIGEDRKLREDRRATYQTMNNEIGKLECEIAIEIKTTFSEENITKMVKDKVTLVNGKIYKFDYFDGQLKSLTFKKETEKKYFLEFIFEDETKKVKNFPKKDFSLSHYINISLVTI